MRGQNRNALAIARVAERNKGVVTRAQLLRAEVSPAAIERRIANGTLLVEYPGVYRLGHRAPSAEAAYLAAVRACGEGAVLSGRAAASHWGLIRGQPQALEVSAPTERRIPGLRTRRRRLHPSEVSAHQGIPVTTVPLTILDLAAQLPAQALARACHEAGVRYRTTPAQVAAVLRRRPNAPGAAKLRAVLTGDEQVSLSKLETGFLELLRAHGLPLPVTNRCASGRRVDCRWPELRLTVELDSYRFHGSRHAWEQDRRRERDAYARGDQFRRYTYGDVFDDQRQILAELLALLRPGVAGGVPA